MATTGSLVYPGIVSVCEATYTNSQGTSPGVILARVNPQSGFPAPRGNAVLSDGITSIPILDCKIESIRADLESSKGISWLIELVDHRWRWRDQAKIDGCYNQLDPNGKLIPSYIRSPAELAILCLAAMGEYNFVLDLPPGLSSADGSNIPEILENGVNFPPSGLNPPINWKGTLAVAALNQVCDLFGRRVVYNQSTGQISIVRPGIGAALPAGSIHKPSQGIQDASWPEGVGVSGSETRFQSLLEMEPVGIEWNGQLKPIDQLSYAPMSPATVQIDHVFVTTPATHSGGVPFFLRLKIQSPTNAELFQEDIYTYTPSSSEGATVTCDAIVAAVNASELGQFITATSVPLTEPHIVLQGNQPGFPFTIVEARWSTLGGPDSPFGFGSDIRRIQSASPARPSWQNCPVPDFTTVRATDRLTFQQARELAIQSVWLLYRATGRDATGTGMLNVPGYGRIVRRNQIVILPTKVDQMVPTVAEQSVLDSNGNPLLLWLYNGYSKDQPASIYGSVAKVTQGSVVFMLRATDPNTLATEKIYTSFSVDPNWQMIQFSDRVYRTGTGGTYQAPRLLMETAINVRRADNNQLACFERVFAFLGAGTQVHRVKWENRPDVQLNIRADYDISAGTFNNVSILEIDPISRADYYLAGLAAQYQIALTQSNEYNNFVAVSLDGAISQITWSFNESGITTEVSRNQEHHPFIPPYPARRRVEALSPSVANQNPPSIGNSRINPMG